jgi:PIN domain nuclease of toxin-antitoxin system
VNLLLDTSIVVPIARLRPEDLNASNRAAVSDPKNLLFVSVASLWEIAIKTRLGKLNTNIALGDLSAYLISLGMQLLVIEATHVLARLQTDIETRDPFDRLIAAQCEVENMRLLTTDPALLAHPLAWRGR